MMSTNLVRRFFLLAIALILTSCFSHDHSHDHDHDHAHHHSHSDSDKDHHDHHHHHHSDGHHHHGSLGAHVHGHMNLSLAVDGKSLFFTLSGSSDGMLGIERKPETEQEKKQWAVIQQTWGRENLLDLFHFTRDLGCHVHGSEVELHIDGSHADIEIEGHIMCNQDITNTTLTSAFMAMYPGIEKLRVDVLPDGKDPYTLEISSSQSLELSL